jgi:hypothetical protein
MLALLIICVVLLLICLIFLVGMAVLLVRQQERLMQFFEELELLNLGVRRLLIHRGLLEVNERES